MSIKKILLPFVRFIRKGFGISSLEAHLTEVHTDIKKLQFELNQTQQLLNSHIQQFSLITQNLHSLTESKTQFENHTKISSILDDILQRQRDLLRMNLNISHSPKVNIKTEHSIASESIDHLQPRGTKNDNSRLPRFVSSAENFFKKEKLFHMDLGCAGGGLVFDFNVMGHFSIGLEGSDYSKKIQRAEWYTLPNNLFTADITKSFEIIDSSNKSSIKFDIITAWEVLEHIHKNDLHSFLSNIQNHLKTGGLFIASVATFEDSDPVTGAQYHLTIESKEWWEEILLQHKLKPITNHGFQTEDFVRGSGNGPLDWDIRKNPEMGFHIVCKKN